MPKGMITEQLLECIGAFQMDVARQETTNWVPEACYLSDVFQPPSKRYEYKQHWRGIKKSDGTLFCFFCDGDYQNGARVDVRDTRGKDNEDVHICHLVLQRLVGLNIEVPSAEELPKERIYNFTRNDSIRLHQAFLFS